MRTFQDLQSDVPLYSSPLAAAQSHRDGEIHPSSYSGRTGNRRKDRPREKYPCTRKHTQRAQRKDPIPCKEAHVRRTDGRLWLLDTGNACKASKRKADVSNCTKVGHGKRILHYRMHCSNLGYPARPPGERLDFTGYAGDHPLVIISLKMEDDSELLPQHFSRLVPRTEAQRRRVYYGSELDVTRTLCQIP